MLVSDGRFVPQLPVFCVPSFCFCSPPPPEHNPPPPPKLCQVLSLLGGYDAMYTPDIAVLGISSSISDQCMYW